MKCSKCNTDIKFQNISLENYKAKCLQCNTNFHVSEKTMSDFVGSIDISNPPRNIQARNVAGEVVFSGNTRTWMSCIFIPVTVILLLLDLFLTGLLLRDFSLIYLVFVTGFSIALIAMFWLCIMSLIGRVELTFQNTKLRIFNGFWKIGITKNIELQKIKDVEIGFTYNEDGHGTYHRLILLTGGKNYSFQPLLFDISFEFLFHLLKKAIFYAKFDKTLELELNLLKHLIELK